MAHRREVLDFRNPTLSKIHYMLGDGLNMLDLDCCEVDKDGNILALDEWKFGDGQCRPLQNKMLKKLAEILDVIYTVTNYFDATEQTKCPSCGGTLFGTPGPIEFAVHAINWQAKASLATLFNLPRVPDEYYWDRTGSICRMNIKAWRLWKMHVHGNFADTCTDEDKAAIELRMKKVNPVCIEPETVDIMALLKGVS